MQLGSAKLFIIYAINSGVEYVKENNILPIIQFPIFLALDGLKLKNKTSNPRGLAHHKSSLNTTQPTYEFHSTHSIEYIPNVPPQCINFADYTNYVQNVNYRTRMLVSHYMSQGM